MWRYTPPSGRSQAGRTRSAGIRTASAAASAGLNSGGSTSSATTPTPRAKEGVWPRRSRRRRRRASCPVPAEMSHKGPSLLKKSGIGLHGCPKRAPGPQSTPIRASISPPKALGRSTQGVFQQAEPLRHTSSEEGVHIPVGSMTDAWSGQQPQLLVRDRLPPPRAVGPEAQRRVPLDAVEVAEEGLR